MSFRAIGPLIATAVALGVVACGCGGRVTLPGCPSSCPAGEVCMPGGCTIVPCTMDSECSEWGRCLDGLCDEQQCRRDEHCREAKVCSEGSCARPCTSEADCEPGERCVSGFCSPPFIVADMVHAGEPFCPAVSSEAVVWTEEIPGSEDRRLIVKPFEGPAFDLVVSNAGSWVDVNDTHLVMSGPHLFRIDVATRSLEELTVFPPLPGSSFKISPGIMVTVTYRDEPSDDDRIHYFETSESDITLMTTIPIPWPGIGLEPTSTIVYDGTFRKVCFMTRDLQIAERMFVYDVTMGMGSLSSFELAVPTWPGGTVEIFYGCAADGFFTLVWDLASWAEGGSLGFIRHYSFEGELLAVRDSGNTLILLGTGWAAPQPVGDRLLAWVGTDGPIGDPISGSALYVWDRVRDERLLVDSTQTETSLTQACPQSLWPHLVWLDMYRNVVRLATFVE